MSASAAGPPGVRIGDETVPWPTDDGPSGVVARADAAAGTGTAGPGTASPARLSLVQQVGRSFQGAYPDVRVLADHGRHLVVRTGELPPGVGEGEGLHWRVLPLEPGAVVVDRPAPQRRRWAPGAGELLDTLSEREYTDWLERLTAPHTRHSLRAGFTETAATAAAALAALGYDVAHEEITVGPVGRSENVVAHRHGSGPAPRRLVVLAAHLDAVNHADGPDGAAPGADDNASGAAGVLETGRVLAALDHHHDLRLILFGGEEQGLHGSRQHVAALAEPVRRRITAVVNLDMVARRNTAAPGVLIEGAPVSRALVDDLVAAAATWTDLTVSTSLNPFASDHVPFIDAGLPAVLTIEDNDRVNTDVHTAGDVLATLEPALALQILRMNLAVLAERLADPGAADRGAVRTEPSSR
ncbi:M28 family metallopeptidase [Georgenia daeguensis]|uniref:Peptidase M28 domain-containing protein n=1 Tax=Georgenia daeguensis TaxID=908355 RepID=A0ABP8EUM9_9MICO